MAAVQRSILASLNCESSNRERRPFRVSSLAERPVANSLSTGLSYLSGTNALDESLAGVFAVHICRPRHYSAWWQPISLDDSLIIEDLRKWLDDQTVVEISVFSDQNCGARFITAQRAKTTALRRIVRRPDFYEPHVISPWEPSLSACADAFL